MFAQPAVIAGVGGDAVKTEVSLSGVNIVQETMQREDARPFGFADHVVRCHAAVRGFDLGSNRQYGCPNLIFT